MPLIFIGTFENPTFTFNSVDVVLPVLALHQVKWITNQQTQLILLLQSCLWNKNIYNKKSFKLMQLLLYENHTIVCLCFSLSTISAFLVSFSKVLSVLLRCSGQPDMTLTGFV